MDLNIENNTDGRKLEVLIVDDERFVLDGLRRQFRNQRDRWNVRFVDSGESALAAMRELPAEVIISDMRMPGMSGAELLRQVYQHWPESVRFVLSGQTDQTELLEHVGYIHQYMQKPCDHVILERAISRTVNFVKLIESPDLRGIVTGIRSLPVVSDTYIRLVQALESEESGADEIAEIVSQDVGLSVKILQMVNTAFFGLTRDIVNLKDAVVLIGISNLTTMVMTVQIFDQMTDKSKSSCFVGKIWAGSNELASRAAQLAKNHGLNKDLRDMVTLCAMFSHIGRAIISQMMPANHEKIAELVKSKGITMDQAEVEVLGVSQELIGAYALGLWGFDEKVIDSVVYQAHPETIEGITDQHPLVWVHQARTQFGIPVLLDKIAIQSEWVNAVLNKDVDTDAKDAA